MRIFWHNGGLQLSPESKRESELLNELLLNIKFERAPQMSGPSNAGQSSGGEDLLDFLVGNHRIAPSSLSRQTGNKDTVVPIHKLR